MGSADKNQDIQPCADKMTFAPVHPDSRFSKNVCWCRWRERMIYGRLRLFTRVETGV